MGRVYSWRPTSNPEKVHIAQTFASRLRSLYPYPVRVFLVGSVANFRDRLFSDIDIRVIHMREYGAFSHFRYIVKSLAQAMFYETGVWIDAKIRGDIPIPLPGKEILAI